MSQKQKTPIQLTLLLSLFAWAAAFYALWHHISLTSGAATESAFCNINSYISCDNVALSTYSTLMGLPLAALAMAFFLVYFVLGTLIYFAEVDKRSEDAKKLSQWLFWSAILSLPVSLFYAAISVFVIKSLCLSCTVIYVLHLALTYLAFKIKKNADSRDPSKTTLSFSVFSLGTLVTFAILAGLNLLMPKFLKTSMQTGPQIEESTLNLYLAQHLNNPQQNFTASAATVGPLTAPVTIVTFSDYQCPYCKLASNIVPTVARSYGDKVRVVYKDFPLSAECNPGMPSSGHPYACPAAKTARCALDHLGIEGYLKISRALFANQEKLSPELIKNLGIDAGLSDEQISACQTSLNIHEAIVADVAEGAAAKVDATPAIFVNGKRLEAAVNPQILRLVIDHYLK